MKVQITFKKHDPGADKEITFTKTFTSLLPEASNQELKDFATAFASLVDSDSFEALKIVSEQL
ncbi:MAG: hypothetical protein Q4D88_06540 [Anaerococcus sp.]|nr:hypothetical protein [Anaerococcus sp.]